MARADQGMGAGATGQQGAKQAGAVGGVTETDLAADIQGNNQLQGNDQLNVQNERKAQAEALQETSSIVENAKKLDPDYRAQTELGKGNRHSPEHDYNANAATGDEGSESIDPDAATHNDPADVNKDAWDERKSSAA